ncbi:hydrolase [Actinoplanes sp. N902-109]|nr:hydrolase [Actinoplanes sp. N902-109]
MLDVYGTLVRDDGEWAAAIAGHVAGLASVPAAQVAREWDTRIWALADGAHGAGFRTLHDLNVASLAATLEHFGVCGDAERWCRRQDEAVLFDDSAAFLAGLDVPVCLVSDADTVSLHTVLRGLGVRADHVVTSEDVRAYKPRPEPFERALRVLGVPASAVVHVGDSPVADIAGAGALGIDTVFVDRRGRGLPAGLRATCVVSTLTQAGEAIGANEANRVRRSSP